MRSCYKIQMRSFSLASLSLALLVSLLLTMLGQQPVYAKGQPGNGAMLHKSLEISAITPKPQPVDALTPQLTPLAFVPVITATKTYTLTNDADGDGQADPGDTLQYTIVISNSGDMDGLNLFFTDILTNLLTLSGTVRTTPLALPDVYSATGNVQINIAAPGVLANDLDLDGGPVTLTPFTGNSVNNGDVILNGDGSFSYNPPAGFEGLDSFDYTISDDEGETDTGTVVISVTDMIWFIDNSAGAAGDGHLNNPFNNLAAFQAVNNGAGNNPAAGDNIFIYTGSSNYSGGLTLLDNQPLFGQGATASLAALTGITPPPGSSPLPGTNGTRPVIVNGGGNGIILAAGNTVRGLNVGAAGGFGLRNNGTSSVGNLTISEVSVNNGSGGGVSLGNGGTLAVTLDSLSSSGGANGVNLVNVGGNFSANGGAIQNASGIAFNVSGGSGVISYTGTINNNSGRSVEVTNRTGGAINLNGAVVDNMATGINLANNSNGTVNFNGTVDISNSTGVAVTLASNTGGAFNFNDIDITNNTSNQIGIQTTGSNSGATLSSITGTINSGTASGVDLNDITLGLTLRSISSSGGSSVGINLIDTTGSFAVIGDDSNSQNGSGGTIINKTGRGVVINRATNITLNSMNITNTSDDGIFAGGTAAGDFVNGFTMQGGFLSSNGDTVNEHGLEFRDVQGTVVFSNTRITDSGEHGVEYFNDSGTISSLTLDNVEIDNHLAGVGFNFELQSGGGNPNLNSAMVIGSNFHDNFATGLFFVNNGGGNMVNVVIGGNDPGDSNTFTNNNIALDISAGAQSNTTIATVISNTTIIGHNSHAMNFASANTAGNTSTNTFNLTVSGNIIGTPGVPDSGSNIGNGIRVNMNDPVDAAILISGNMVNGIGATNVPLNPTEFGRGIEVVGRLGAGTTDVTIIGNNVTALGGPALFISADAGEAGGGHQITANISGNTFNGGFVEDFGVSGFVFNGGDVVLQEVQNGNPGAGIFRLEGTAVNAVTQIGNTNTASNGEIHEIDDSGQSGATNIAIVPAGTTQIP